jgi:hypothetical protein
VAAQGSSRNFSIEPISFRHVEDCYSAGERFMHETDGRIVETAVKARGPNAGGRPHLISIKWVDYVDAKIHLNKPSKKAMMEWQVAA